MGKKILLVGEPMGLLIAEDVGKLEDVERFSMTTCGAELNVAVGVTRLDCEATYLTRLGDDIFGRKIRNAMEKNGIATDQIRWSDSIPTGFMFKEKVLSGDPGIAYFRKGSAASTLGPEDIEAVDFSQFDMVHLTGITPALSASCREMAELLNWKAKKAGCLFSFDPNIRPQLWPSKEVMVDYLNSMAAKSDLFLPGINEAKILIGEETPEKIAQTYMEMGAKTVVVKVGAKGAYYANASGESGMVSSFPVEKVVDTVGAGDGFAAGVISGLLHGLPIVEAVRRGCAIGAIQVMTKGDNDGLPYSDELQAFMQGESDWRRTNG